MVAGGITMAIHGFQKVKASIMWAASVVTTANITQTTFLPVLSTIKPRSGDAGAEMMYTMLGKIENGMKAECNEHNINTYVTHIYAMNTNLSKGKLHH